MHIGGIADDFTGATDLALMLSRGGLKVLQIIGVPQPGTDFGDAQAVVVSLKSRTIAADEAVTQSLAAAKALLAANASQIFFKYCSTFDSTDRGNIGPVTDALLDLLQESRTIACPAFPANGRIVFKGHLFVGDMLLSDSSMKDHPLTPMRDANLVRVLQRQTSRPVSLIARDVVAAPKALEQALVNLEGIAIIDAVTDDDLRAIGRAARGLKLITGGSGIALGLPGNFAIGAKDRKGEPTLMPAGGAAILAGSCSTATRRQIEHAVAAGFPALQLDALTIAEGRTKVEDAAAFVMERQGRKVPLVYSSADPVTIAAVQGKLGRDASGALVEDFLASLAALLAARGINRFLVAGGETSGAVVSALGVPALTIGPEIDPGVPWTRSHDRAAPIALALKSGNFGADDFFIKAWEVLQ